MCDEGRGRFDPSYWVEHCEGFAAYTLDGRLGFVEAVHADEDGTPFALLIRSEGAGVGLICVPVVHVAVVQPHRERIVLEYVLEPVEAPAARRVLVRG